MPVAINQGFIALKCNERASNFFMLNWCQTNMAEIESRATGTTFAEISKQNFRPIRVVLPPKELMAAFTAKVAPLYAQITANLHQSRTLATLRDTLLPKLLSGELSVAGGNSVNAELVKLKLRHAMSKNKPTPGGRAKKKAEVSLVRSSAAEYLTFIAAGGDSEASVECATRMKTSGSRQKMMAGFTMWRSRHQLPPEEHFQRQRAGGGVSYSTIFE